MCHIGIIDAGHYFTFYNDIRLEKDEQIRLSLFELNDDCAEMLQNPCQELDTISGKAGKPEQWSEESSTSRSSITKSAGFGKTGYMYFYQNVAQWFASQGMTSFPVSDKLRAVFYQSNQEQLEIYSKVSLTILTNITAEQDGARTAFSVMRYDDANGEIATPKYCVRDC